MNAYSRYKNPEPSVGWTRIDLLLALYDGALTRLDRAKKALEAGDTTNAIPLISRVQMIVTQLATGVRLDVDPDMGTNYLRLYEFVVYHLAEPSVDRITECRKILETLREGFESIRAEAIELERTGQFINADRLQMVLATA